MRRPWCAPSETLDDDCVRSKEFESAREQQGAEGEKGSSGTHHAEASVVEARELEDVPEREDGLGEEVEDTVCIDGEEGRRRRVSV